ncbi:hypothetical protein BKA70DRAFT_1513945, partial [Coprinopsis sp. MPI-PUGE-AT-0042]
AIISHNRYHLRISSHWNFYLKDEESNFLARYLLFEAAPTPTSLIVGSFKVFKSILLMDNSCESVTSFTFRLPHGDLDNFDIPRLPIVFPKLKSFSTNARIAFSNPFSCHSLRFLILLDVVAASEDFARLCMGLPCLQELKISSENLYEIVEPITPLNASLIHSALEIVLILGEDVLLLLAHLTLPTLKFFGLEAWGMRNGGEVVEKTLLDFFRRSNLSNLKISLKGSCRKCLFSSLTRNLPPATTLLSNLGLVWKKDKDGDGYGGASLHTFNFKDIKEMVCSDLSWLQEIEEQLTCNGSIKVYAPMDMPGKEQIWSTTKNMCRKGIELSLLPPDAMEGVLSSLVPRMTIEWNLKSKILH